MHGDGKMPPPSLPDPILNLAPRVDYIRQEATTFRISCIPVTSYSSQSTERSLRYVMSSFKFSLGEPQLDETHRSFHVPGIASHGGHCHARGARLKE